MRYLSPLFRLIFLVSLTSVASDAFAADAAVDTDIRSTSFRSNIQPFLTKYCASCHGGAEPIAELKLDEFKETPSVVDNRDQWESIVEMLRFEEMPPEGEPQPDEKETSQFIQWVESGLGQRTRKERRTAGRVTIRRLNRVEYNNTIRDLVGLDFKPAEDFPADDVGHGFDNNGDVLSLPPLLMEKYLAAAQEIVSRAMEQPETRSRIITCWPSEEKARRQCAREVIVAFATRAFRRPVADDEVDGLMQLVQLAESQGVGYRQGLELALQAILVSPHFLFRVELDDPGDLTIERPLSDYELATRLSYFLWSSTPDEELLTRAAEGRLSDDEVLAGQVMRMLADPKAKALVENFAGQWLELRNLAKAAPDPDRYPDFDDLLRVAMLRETQLFVEAIVQEDRSILDLLDTDYTFVNERLARHYGIEDVAGKEFQRISLSDGRRGGVLTHASILTLTSNPTRTSPVKRGKWILENILGAPPPPPPPNIPELAEGEETELLGSLRERMEQHRSNPSCAVCHKTMDALGFGFENFDGIGAWRDRDGRFQIDPAGQLPGNQTFSGPEQLKVILKKTKQGQFVRCAAGKMLTYAIGRGLESYDREAVDKIVESVANGDHHFSSLVLAVVRSDPFRKRGGVEPANE